MISCRSYHHIKHGQWFLQGIIYGRLFIYISNLLLHVPVVYHVVFLFPLGEKWIWRPMSAKWRTFVPGSCLSMVGTPLEPRDKIPWQLVSYCWNSRRISTPALEDHLTLPYTFWRTTEGALLSPWDPFFASTFTPLQLICWKNKSWPISWKQAKKFLMLKERSGEFSL